MNLGDLQSARSKERQKDSLQHLSEDFYAEVGEFVTELRTERERAAEAADDPFDAPEVRRLTDDIKTAENTVEAIYERRVGKLVKLASLDAAGMPADEDGLTNEEKDLFSTLVEAIESNRAHVLDDVLSGDESSAAQDTSETNESTVETDAAVAPTDTATDELANPTEPAGTAESTTPEPPAAADTANEPDAPSETEDGVSAAEAMGADASASGEESLAETGRAPAGTDDAGDETPGTDDTDRTTVRITRDVGEIFGVDERTYHLTSEDIVTLPEVNAAPLLERNAAEQLD